MAEPSAAILCIALGEQPFAAEWLEYHLALGFDHIYYIITDTEFEAAHSFYAGAGFGDRVSWHRFDQQYTGWQLGAYCEFLTRFTQDWLMVMDLDEFLYFPGGETIGAYLAALDTGIGQVQFPWLTAPLQNYRSSSVLGSLAGTPKFANNHVKSIARRGKLASIGVHAHRVGGAKTVLSSGKLVKPDHFHTDAVRDPSYYQRHPFVLHAVSRGHIDILNRICGHRFNNVNCGHGERARLRKLLTGRPVWSALPNRLLLQKVQQAFPRVTLHPKLPRLSRATDSDLLLDMFLQQINTIVDFQCSSREDFEAAFESRYMLDYKINRFDVTGFVDIEEYLQSSTQLDYIVRLRNRLELGETGG